MSKVSIAVLGSKGGVGKTTISHMFAFGLSKFNFKIMHVTTDKSRESLLDDNRPYSTRSGQTLETLGKVFKWFSTLDDNQNSLIVDGGGNRDELDESLAKYVDLVIIPFKDSEEDMRVLLADMKRIPTAFALPSAWPTNQWARNQAHKMLEKVESEFPGRVLQPLNQMRATQGLLSGDFKSIDSSVISASKNLVEQALNKLNINVYVK